MNRRNKHICASCKPQENGAAKRFNQSILEELKKYLLGTIIRHGSTI